MANYCTSCAVFELVDSGTWTPDQMQDEYMGSDAKNSYLCCVLCSSAQKSIRGHVCTHHKELYPNKNNVGWRDAAKVWLGKKVECFDIIMSPSTKKIVLHGNINTMLSYDMSVVLVVVPYLVLLIMKVSTHQSQNTTVSKVRVKGRSNILKLFIYCWKAKSWKDLLCIQWHLTVQIA